MALACGLKPGDTIPLSQFHITEIWNRSLEGAVGGGNVDGLENAAYGAVMCAERTAFFTAVCEGERDFAAIAIAGGREGEVGDVCAPCGICRQVMAEFCAPDFEVILASGEGVRAYRLDEILPLSFTKENL